MFLHKPVLHLFPVLGVQKSAFDAIMVEELKVKIQRIIAMYNAVKADKSELLLEKIQLINTIEEQQERIIELERKYRSLQVAKAVTTGEDTDIAKKKCIALLNQ